MARAREQDWVGEPMISRAPESDVDPELLALRRWQRARAARTFAVLSVVCLLAAGLWVRRSTVASFVRGEIDLRGNPRYQPRHEIDWDALNDVDLARVHATLVPRYLVALATIDTPASRRRAEYAYRDLADELAADPNLSAMWSEIHALATASVLRNARRLDYLLWAHDQYMEQLDAPYRIEATLHLDDDRAVLSALTYRVLSETRAPGGPRVRVLRRLDRFAIVEGWLGHTPSEDAGAFVVADRVLHFAVHTVWPALHPALDERRPPAQRGLLQGVRREARMALSTEAYALLEELAEDQQALLDAAETIHARHACGSEFSVFDIPYTGLSTRSVQMLRMALERSRDRECPDVTLGEAASIVGASERLRASAALPGALEELTALVGRAVAAHEVRHVADGARADVPCPGCAEGTPALVRAELSAYLAGFATPGVGYVAALQACSHPRDVGLHALAIEQATSAVIDGGCNEAAPDDLYARARAAEARYFGERPQIGAPRGFPRELAVLGGARRGRRRATGWAQ